MSNSLWRFWRRAALAACCMAAASLTQAQEPAPAAPAAPPAPAADKDWPGVAKLILPPVVYAAPGLEANIYFDNVTLLINPENFIFDVTCVKGTQQHERWTFVPAPEDVGRHPLVLEVRDQQNAVVARATTIVQVVPADAGAGQKISMLIIGDSLTAASVYPRHLLEVLKAEGNPSVALIGSHGPGGKPGEVSHEGYGGWTAAAFATRFTGIARTGDRKDRGSPFIYKEGEDQPKLDFPRYCAELNNGQPPDVVTIFLGCNDTFRGVDDDIDKLIDDMFKHYDTLIAMIHGYSKNTAIGAFLPVPPAATQDAFGANYKCGQTRWQYKRNQTRVVERMMERYGGREKENLWLVPVNVNLDCRHNYPQVTVPWNSRTAEKGVRLNNGVHPAADGYRQIGDSLCAWLKAVLAQRQPQPPAAKPAQ